MSSPLKANIERATAAPTVKELITLLCQMPGDSHVYISHSKYDEDSDEDSDEEIDCLDVPHVKFNKHNKLVYLFV